VRCIAWLLLLAFVVACSSRDETLGRTRPTPQPTIDVDPQPQPNPNPDPEPSPDLPPCERTSNRMKYGECLAPQDCHRGVIDRPGYECYGDTVCCNVTPVGCTLDCCSPDCATSQGGQGSGGAGGAAGSS
jgi:hypothetical protein